MPEVFPWSFLPFFQAWVTTGSRKSTRPKSDCTEPRRTGWRCFTVTEEGPAKAWHINYMQPHYWSHSRDMSLYSFCTWEDFKLNGCSVINQWLDYTKVFLMHFMNHKNIAKQIMLGLSPDCLKGERQTSKPVTASCERPSTYGPRTLCSLTLRDCRLLKKKRRLERDRKSRE